MLEFDSSQISSWSLIGGKNVSKESETSVTSFPAYLQGPLQLAQTACAFQCGIESVGKADLINGKFALLRKAVMCRWYFVQRIHKSGLNIAINKCPFPCLR